MSCAPRPGVEQSPASCASSAGCSTPLGIELIAQAELGIAEADEPHATFVENALAKARHACAQTGLPALADDSGICVDALRGAPGVHSARATRGEPQVRRAQQRARSSPSWRACADRRAHYYCVLVLVRHADDPRAADRRRPLARRSHRHAARQRTASATTRTSSISRPDSTAAELARAQERSCRIAAWRCARCSRALRRGLRVSTGRAPATACRARTSPGRTFTALPPLALYVHIPWCVRKCPYCDFNSHEARGRVARRRVCRRAASPISKARCRRSGAAGRHRVHRRRHAEPVLARGDRPAAVGDARALPLAPTPKITLEANPGTFERAKFARFRASGVNRLSVGIQSFDAQHLRALGRIHDADEARRAAEAALAIFGNFNLDLMFALPQQTLDEAPRDVDAALAFAPPHLSLYHLTLEPNTLFHRYPPPLPDDDAAADIEDAIQRALARRRLRALRDLGVCAARHRVPAQPELLALRRLPRHRRGRAYEAVVPGPDRAPDALQAAAAVHGRRSRAAAPLQEERSRARDLPFEFMLNALRLTDGVPASLFAERTGNR